jgi:hypothetical protein
MAENHSNVYIAHTDASTQKKLSSIFQTLNDIPRPDLKKIEETLILSSEDLLTVSGSKFALELIHSVKNNDGIPANDLRAESKQEINGYCSYHFVHGENGEKIITAIIQFIGDIAPKADVRAWLVGDDDPWEVLFRYESGAVNSKKYEPSIEERNMESLPSEYVWWHKDLPSEISEGFINEWKSLEDDEWEKEWIIQEDTISVVKMGPHCPYCGGELRSPRAKQCPSCMKNWHNDITIRMDDDVISYFKKVAQETDIPYQRLMNSYLKDCAEKERKPKMVWSGENDS